MESASPAADPAAPELPRSRWIADLVLVMAPSVMLSLSLTLIIPVLPMVAQQFGTGAAARLLAQYAVAIPAIGIMVGAPVAGFLLRRVGIPAMLVVSAAVYGIAGAAGMLSGDAAGLLASRLVMGLGAGVYAPAATALLAQRWAGTRRAGLLGYRGAVGAAVGLIGLLAGGRMADVWGWRAPFSLYGAALLLIPLAAGLRLPRPVFAAKPRVELRADWMRMLPIFAGALPLYIVMFAKTTQLPLLLADIGIAVASQRSVILSAGTITACLAAMLYGPIRGRLGSRPTLLVTLICYGVGLTAMAAMDGPALAVLAGAACGVAMGLVPAYFDHQVLEEAAPEIRAPAIAMLVTVHYLGQFLNPVLIGTLGAFLGLRTALAIWAAAMLLWAAVSIVRGGAGRSASYRGRPVKRSEPA